MQKSKRLLNNPTLLQDAMEIGKIAFWELDLPSGRLFRSENHDLLYGFDTYQEEWTFEHFFNVVHPEDSEKLVNEFKNMVEQSLKHVIFEFRVVWPNGELRWLNSKAYLTKDESGSLISFYGTLFDITELKRTKEGLRSTNKAREDFLSFASHELRTPISTIKLQTQLLKRNLAQVGDVPLDRIKKFLDVTESQVDRLNHLIDEMPNQLKLIY